MTTFGDKPYSRWKRKRVVRRLAQLAAVAAMLSVAFFLLLAAAFSSEAFWRRVLIPQFVGPLWESTVDYDSLQPQAFPPGVTLQNVRFHEPGPGGALVASVEKFHLRTSYDLRTIDIRSLHIRGLTLNYVVHPDGNTNVNIAVERLFDRMPPSERLSDRVREGEQVVPRVRLRQVFVRGISVRYEDRRDPARPVSATYTAPDQLGVFLQKDADLFRSGFLNDYLRIESHGDWAVQAGEWCSGGPATVTFELPSVDRFPNSRANLKLELSPESGQRRFTASAELPLERLPFRAMATPLENIRAEFTDAADAKPLVRFHDGRIDPLKGDLEGSLSINASWDDLLGTARAFLDDNGYALLNHLVDQKMPDTLQRRMAESAGLEAEIRVKGTGIAQYAIIDPSEAVPLELATEGYVGLRHLDASLVRPLIPGYADIVPLEAAEPMPMDLDASWRLSALEKENIGALWLHMDARPQVGSNHEIRIALGLSRQDRPNEPVIFHPFGGAPLAPLLEKTLTTTPTLTTDYRFLPQYEPLVSMIGAHLSGAEEALDQVGLEDAMLSQEVAITDPPTLRAIVAPFWQIDGATSGTLAVSLARPGLKQPSIVRAAWGISGARVRGVPDPVSVAAQAEASLDGPLVTLNSFESSLARGNGAGERVLRFGLADRMPDGVEGPLLPSRIDLSTGRAHGEFEVTTIRREIVEVLLQLQTFGLSERLAQPLNQRFLQLLGFRPHDLTASSEATIYLSGDMGPLARVRSVLRMNGLPAANFLFLEKANLRGSEVFNARLFQSAALDRRTQKIRPEAFDLQLSTLHRNIDVPFAILRLEPDEETLLSYPDLLRLAAVEAGQFGKESSFGPRRLKMMVSGFFQRLERFKAATSGAGGRVIFELPNVELSQFSETLASAGLPVTEGTLDLKLVNSLRGTGAAQQALAYGKFSLSDIRIAGMAGNLPRIEGGVDLGQQGERLVLENLVAQMEAPAGTEPVALRFQGWTNIADDASHWELRLDHLNGRLVKVLEQIETAGLGRSTAILESLPFQRLDEIAGEKGEVNFRFEADTDAAGQSARLQSRQSGRDLIVFPTLFAPLSFDLRQDVSTSSDGSITVEALQGSLREEAVREPLLSLNLDKPVSFGTRANSEISVLTISARKDLGEVGRRLQEIPIPLFERRILSGLAEGKLDVRFAKGAFANPDSVQATNTFDLAVRDVMLEGLDTPLAGVLKGNVERTTDTLTLSNVALETSVDGKPTGSLQIDATYSLISRYLSGSIDLVDFRSQLLQVLPPQFARWARNDDSRLNGSVLAVIDPNAGCGEMELQLRARDFAMAPLAMDDGTLYQHPPLQLDLDVSASYDQPTSSVLVQSVSAILAKGEDHNPDRMAKLDPTLPPLVRVTESAPFRYDVATGELLRTNESGAGMDLEFGPIDMTEYGAPIRQVSGISVMKGTVGGSGSVLASGGPAARFDVSKLGFFLRDGVWTHADGTEQPLEADLVFRGGSRPDVFRLDELSAQIRYPEAEEDHLSLNGFVESKAGIDHAELNAMSRGVKLDRLLRMLQDMQAYRTEVPRTGAQELPRKPFEFPERLTATLNGSLDNIRFKELSFPHTEVRANYANKQVELEEFRSRLEQGLVSVQGVADFAEPRVPWSMKLRVEDLEARPWVNSFGTPKAHDTVRGKFLANASVRGEGFTDEDLARNLVAEGIFGLRQGEVIDEGFRNVFGGESEFAADLYVIARNNRALFELSTPWNPARDVLMRGTLFNLFALGDDPAYIRALVNFTRTTTVGPRWRRIDEDGKRVPLRQTLFGMVMEIRGPVGKDESADLSLRSLEY